jgi:hypothetical protein
VVKWQPDFLTQQAALRPPKRDPLALGRTLERRPESCLAKPNYRHQKKQKELARKTRHAEKLKKRLERDDAAAPDGADLQTTAPEGSVTESKP